MITKLLRYPRPKSQPNTLGFACKTYTERNGVLAYLYDAKYVALDEYFSAISPTGKSEETYSCAASSSSDPLLHEGDKVSFEGITIEMFKHGDFDRVKITCQ